MQEHLTTLMPLFCLHFVVWFFNTVILHIFYIPHYIIVFALKHISGNYSTWAYSNSLFVYYLWTKNIIFKVKRKMNNIQQILKDLLAHYQKCWFPALTINKNLDLSVGLPSQSSSVPFAFLDSTSGNFLFAQTSPFRTSFRQICWQYLLSFVVDTFASYKILTCKLYSFSSCHHFFFQLTVCIIISVLRIMTVFPFCFFFL